MKNATVTIPLEDFEAMRAGDPNTTALIDALTDEITRLQSENKKLSQTITDLERERIKNDKPWYTKFGFVLAIAFTLASCSQEATVYEAAEEQVGRNETIRPWIKTKRNDTLVVLDGDSRIRKYCCTVYYKSGRPYGDCYTSSGECVTCQTVCDELR